MQNKESGDLVRGELSEEMARLFGKDPEEAERRIRKEFDASEKVRGVEQGPLFVEGEVLPLRGYGYKVHAIVKVDGKPRIVLTPHGPLDEADELSTALGAMIKEARK